MRPVTELYPKEGYVKKQYGRYPNVEDVLYYYQLQQDTGLLPEIYSIDIDGQWLRLEYISGQDGYAAYRSGIDIVQVLCNLAEVLRAEGEITRVPMYEARLKDTYTACMRVLRSSELGKSLAESLSNVTETFFNNVMDVWNLHFAGSKRYIIHGDLHPGNILYDGKAGMWRVIDPIVSVAPLEYEYVRFIENQTYLPISSVLSDDGSGQDRVSWKALRTVIEEILSELLSQAPELEEARVVQALFVDSVLRCMETIVDLPEAGHPAADIQKSIAYCRMVEELSGMLGKGGV